MLLNESVSCGKADVNIFKCFSFQQFQHVGVPKNLSNRNFPSPRPLFFLCPVVKAFFSEREQNTHQTEAGQLLKKSSIFFERDNERVGSTPPNAKVGGSLDGK